MSYPKSPFLFRPYLRNELPGWGRLFGLLQIGGLNNENPRWRDGPTLKARGKSHGYPMELDLREDQDRYVYFMGRYYDHEIQMALDAILEPGDTFIDVGANIGMMSLHAARLVAPGGRVISFEPQPGCCAKLGRNLDLAGIGHVRVHNVGLSDSPGELSLKVVRGTTIMSAFAIDEAADRAAIVAEVPVPVARGDDLVEGQIVGRLSIKVDVEGFELYALRGLAGTIERHRPLILTEVVPRYLLRAGTDAGQLFGFLHDRGYRGHVIELRTRRLRRPRLGLRRVDRPDQMGDGNDLLWVPDDGERFDPRSYL